MIPKTPRTSANAARLVQEAATTREAKAKLEALVEAAARDLPSAFVAPTGTGLALEDVDAAFARTANTQAKVVKRRLDQCIRTLRREGEGRASEPALRVLANDALRLVVEHVAWRRLGELATQHTADGGASGPSNVAVRQGGSARFATIQQLHRRLTSDDPARFRGLATLAFRDDDNAAPAAGPAAHARLEAHEREALADILGSNDPLVNERLAGGESLDAVRPLLLERMIPVSMNPPEKADLEATKKDAGGLMFDLGTNTFVQRDRSWAYPISLGQLFDYEVDGICDGKEELKSRLVVAATEPTTGELVGATAEQIERFVDDLAAAASAQDPVVDQLLSSRFTMCFSTTDHGSKPVRSDWDLPQAVVADLFSALTSDDLRQTITDAAGREAERKAAREKQVQGAVGDLLQRYPGVPVRHKRAHAALINLGLANQSIQQMGRDDGVLPKSETRLDAESLKTKYGDADHLKLRYLFTDEMEMYVVSDETFQRVVDEYHFPPNHELLSYNRPIAGSGYVTVHEGRVVGLEDDIEMLPGKLPDNLPPAIDVLTALGFDLDMDAIRASQRVLDWEGFVDGTKAADLPAPIEGDPAAIREALIGCDHADRPALVAATVKHALDGFRKNDSEPVARSKTEDFVKQILEGFQIINVAAKHFRGGDLPSNMSEFMEMKIDDVLAPFVVRKAAGE